MKKQYVRVLVGVGFFCLIYSLYRIPKFNVSPSADSEILQKLTDDIVYGGHTGVPQSTERSLKDSEAEMTDAGHAESPFKEKHDKVSIGASYDHGKTTKTTERVKDINNIDAGKNSPDVAESHPRDKSVKLESDQIEEVNSNDLTEDDFGGDIGDFIYNFKDEDFNISSIKQHQEEDEQIFKTFPNHQNETKYLIYYCDVKCGGLADRLKGIIMVYMMSLLSNRKFAINMTTPCELEHFLVPNLLDWRVPPREEIAGKRIMILDFFERYDAFKIDYLKNDIDPATKLITDYALMKSNQDWTRIFRTLSVSPERFPQLYTYHSSDLSRIIYHGLFKPSEQLDQLVNTFFKENVGSSKLACLHARMGEADYIRYTMEQIATPLNFLKQYDEIDGYKIVVATDSKQVKELSRTMFKNFIDTSGGPIMHVDYMLNGSRSDTQKCSGFMRTMVDHMTLRRCDNLVLTSSGFGVSAASLRHTSRGLHVYMKDDIVMTTKRELLREVYQWRCIWRWWGYGRTDFYSNICDG